MVQRLGEPLVQLLALGSLGRVDLALRFKCSRNVAISLRRIAAASLTVFALRSALTCVDARGPRLAHRAHELRGARVTIVPIGSSSTSISKLFCRSPRSSLARVVALADLVTVGVAVPVGVVVVGIGAERDLLGVGEAVAVRVEAVGVGLRRVGADRELLAVGQPVAVGVGLLRVELAAGVGLLAVVDPVPVGVDASGSGRPGPRRRPGSRRRRSRRNAGRAPRAPRHRWESRRRRSRRAWRPAAWAVPHAAASRSPLRRVRDRSSPRCGA